MSGKYIKNGMRNLPTRQHGAVLVIGLLILLVLTLLGVTSMSTSTMEERMSSNSMNANFAFQMAETAVTSAMKNLTTVVTAMNSANAVSGPTVTYGSGNLAATGNSQVTYVGEGVAEGFSIGLTQGTYAAHHFQVQATGTVTAANATSATDQGTVFIGPK